MNRRHLKVVTFFAAIICCVSFLSMTSQAQIPDDEISRDYAVSDPSLRDGRAEVYGVKGYVALIKKSSPIEKKVKRGDVIESGDTIETGTGANISIRFDDGKKNVIRIPADSKATFVNIEPTEIKIENGSIFNIVDGLANGSHWKVSTPAAVAAVRGTVFLVTYGISGGDFFAATLDVPDDGKNSMIEIGSLTGAGSVMVSEGNQLDFKKGAVLDQQNVQLLNPTAMNEIRSFYEEVKSERQEPETENGATPEALAEFTESTCDADGRNCSSTVCHMTDAGKVCDY